MVLGLGKEDGRDTDVAALIARKQYGRAIEVLKAQLSTGRPDDRARLQLGDVLEKAGKTHEAVAIFTSLADGYARDGFAAKAISMLKRIERLDPGRRDVSRKLASLIEEKQRLASVPVAPGPSLEIGMEEIGFDSGSVRSVSVPVDEPPAPEVAFEPEPPPRPSAPPPRAPARAAEPAPFALEEDEGLVLEPDVAAEPEVALPEPEPAPEPPPLDPVVDMDLVADDGLPEITLDADPVEEALPEVLPEPTEAEPDMSEAAFGDELLALVDSAFGGLDEVPEEPPAGAGGQQIVVSPLFKDFSVDELVAVIQGLTLLSFEAGQVVITEGDAGDSLYMLTSGSVQVIRKTPQGRRTVVGSLKEGAFFGEGSILTGRPRTATVVAASRCEMLELDRETLDGIVATHPRVRQILEQFARERLRGRPSPTS
jgi:hypothetical protein